jgi:hypothetical protein
MGSCFPRIYSGPHYRGALRVWRRDLRTWPDLADDLDDDLRVDVLAYGIAAFCGEQEPITSTQRPQERRERAHRDQRRIRHVRGTQMSTGNVASGPRAGRREWLGLDLLVPLSLLLFMMLVAVLSLTEFGIYNALAMSLVAGRGLFSKSGYSAREPTR